MMHQEVNQHLYSVEEVAARFDLKRSTIKQYVGAGCIEGTKDASGQIAFTQKAIDDFAKRRAVYTQSPSLELVKNEQKIARSFDRSLTTSEYLDPTGKPDAEKLARPVWSGGKVARLYLSLLHVKSAHSVMKPLLEPIQML